MWRGILRVVTMTIISILLISAAFTGGFVVSHQIFPPSPYPDGGAPTDWKPYFPVFWEAWNWVQKDYYRTPIDSDDLVNGSVAGMVQALGDQHTAFVDAKRAVISRSELEGSFEGIGATIEMREGRLTIVSPIKGTPADRAGLLPGDIILRVGDTVIQNMDVNEAVRMIRGPKGSKVKLLIQRTKQAPFDIEITRDTIRTPFVESRIIESTSIAYLRLNEFGSPAPDEMRNALRDLLAQKPTGLVFDLRRNPGGYLNVSIDIASQFLKSGQVVLIEKDKTARPQEFKAKGGGIATEIPMVLLIDAGSASASEIVAAALKDHQRAKLIGVKTFGKGSVQNVHTLSDKSELRVTIARFFGPNGDEIHEVGVSPDIEVKVTDDDLANRLDPQLDRAVLFLQTGK